MTDGIFLGGGGVNYAEPQVLVLKYANRHGLIAGATGTGKSVTLKILAEEFSAAGVPVFLSDVKSDLAGTAFAGDPNGKLHEAFTSRAKQIGMEDFKYASYPVTFWDLFGEQGHPVRTTISEMGPLMLSRLMNLSEAQEGVLNIAFRVADEQGMPLLDIKDLQSLLVWVGQNATDLSLRYGNVSPNSIGTIQRNVLQLEQQGADKFFGEPALDLHDMMTVDPDGRGRINILASDKLMTSPKLYATFLLWMLSELFETLPEVGDPDKPKLVFFFDEAHLLFDGTPEALVDKVEQVVRLIRSKGVGIYFVTQNPGDIPDKILGQLGNRVQHALRAFTGRDQIDLKRAAQTYRPNPDFDTATAIQGVGVGEALTSPLEKGGVPGMVQKTLIRPPSTRSGPITQEERAQIIAASPVAGKYETLFDRRSAFEILKERADAAAKEAEAAQQQAEQADSAQLRDFAAARRYAGKNVERSTSVRAKANQPSLGSAVTSAVIKELQGSTGRMIVRGILGSLFKGR